MKSPLIVDHTDSKWLLLEQIIGATTSRRAKQEIAKQGITPVNNAGTMLRILILSMFFSVEVTYVVEELRTRKELQSFLCIEVIPEADNVYRFFSRIDEDHFIAMINGLIRDLSRTSRKRKDKNNHHRRFCDYP